MCVFLYLKSPMIFGRALANSMGRGRGLNGFLSALSWKGVDKYDVPWQRKWFIKLVLWEGEDKFP